MDVVPRRLDVTEIRHVVDVQRRDHVIADEGAEAAVLAGQLAADRVGIGQGRTVTAAQDVGAGPGQDPETASGERRRQRGAQEGLAGLAVLTGVRDLLARQGLQHRQAQGRGRGEAGEGGARPDRGERIETARWQRRTLGIGERFGEELRIVELRTVLRQGLGGGQVHDHDTVELVSGAEVRDVSGQAIHDGGLRVRVMSGHPGADLRLEPIEVGAGGGDCRRREHSTRRQLLGACLDGGHVMS